MRKRLPYHKTPTGWTKKSDFWGAKRSGSSKRSAEGKCQKTYEALNFRIRGWIQRNGEAGTGGVCRVEMKAAGGKSRKKEGKNPRESDETERMRRGEKIWFGESRKLAMRCRTSGRRTYELKEQKKPWSGNCLLRKVQ